MTVAETHLSLVNSSYGEANLERLISPVRHLLTEQKTDINGPFLDYKFSFFWGDKTV